jgi:hypothetical protein
LIAVLVAFVIAGAPLFDAFEPLETLFEPLAGFDPVLGDDLEKRLPGTPPLVGFALAEGNDASPEGLPPLAPKLVAPVEAWPPVASTPGNALAASARVGRMLDPEEADAAEDARALLAAAATPSAVADEDPIPVEPL